MCTNVFLKTSPTSNDASVFTIREGATEREKVRQSSDFIQIFSVCLRPPYRTFNTPIPSGKYIGLHLNVTSAKPRSINVIIV